MKPKIVVNIAVINRPKTSEECIKRFLQFTPRDKVILIVQDQNSNDETKTMLRRYEKDFDVLEWHDFNWGCNFEINKGMSYCDPDQHFLDVNSDWWLYSDWYEQCMSIIEDEDVGIVAGRRDCFWIDRPEKFIMYKSGVVIPEQRHGHWCERVENSLIIAPFWMISNKIIEKVGYQSEVTMMDDVDYYHRVARTGLKSYYCVEVLARQPQDEIQDHPQYSSHRMIMQKTQGLARLELLKYARGDIYRGTRFIPATIDNEDYRRWSDYNWNWLKEWPNVQ